jgi:hypothetical protein
MSSNTEIRHLSKEAQKRRQQTELLHKRVERLKDESKKNRPTTPSVDPIKGDPTWKD